MRSRSSSFKDCLAWPVVALIILAAFIHPASAAEQDPTALPHLQGKKVALVIPFARYNRYLHEELINAFDTHGVDATIVSSQQGKATPNQGAEAVTVEMTIDQVDMKTFDALIFAGGGALYTEFANDPYATALIQQAAKMDRVLAGLDLGKAVLVNAGVLDYRIPDTRDAVGAAVTVKGKIITGNSGYVVQPFIKSLFNVLNGN